MGAVIGNFVSGALTDAPRQQVRAACFPWRSRRCPCSCWPFMSLPPVGAGHLSGLGITGWIPAPIQHHLLSLSKRFGALTVSLNSSVLAAGIAAGGMPERPLTLYALPAYLPLFSAAARRHRPQRFDTAAGRPAMSKALPVLYERHGEPVAVTTLNRPERTPSTCRL
ncbi:hypothetical protein M8494_15655 [Serratia ureilytica]